MPALYSTVSEKIPQFKSFLEDNGDKINDIIKRIDLLKQQYEKLRLSQSTGITQNAAQISSDEQQSFQNKLAVLDSAGSMLGNFLSLVSNPQVSQPELESKILDTIQLRDADQKLNGCPNPLAQKLLFHCLINNKALEQKSRDILTFWLKIHYQNDDLLECIINQLSQDIKNAKLDFEDIQIQIDPIYDQRNEARSDLKDLVQRLNKLQIVNKKIKEIPEANSKQSLIKEISDADIKKSLKFIIPLLTPMDDTKPIADAVTDVLSKLIDESTDSKTLKQLMQGINKASQLFQYWHTRQSTEHLSSLVDEFTSLEKKLHDLIGSTDQELIASEKNQFLDVIATLKKALKCTDQNAQDNPSVITLVKNTFAFVGDLFKTLGQQTNEFVYGVPEDSISIDDLALDSLNSTAFSASDFESSVNAKTEALNTAINDIDFIYQHVLEKIDNANTHRGLDERDREENLSPNSGFRNIAEPKDPLTLALKKAIQKEEEKKGKTSTTTAAIPNNAGTAKQSSTTSNALLNTEELPRKKPSPPSSAVPDATPRQRRNRRQRVKNNLLGQSPLTGPRRITLPPIGPKKSSLILPPIANLIPPPVIPAAKPVAKQLPRGLKQEPLPELPVRTPSLPESGQELLPPLPDVELLPTGSTNSLLTTTVTLPTVPKAKEARIPPIKSATSVAPQKNVNPPQKANISLVNIALKQHVLAVRTYQSRLATLSRDIEKKLIGFKTADITNVETKNTLLTIKAKLDRRVREINTSKITDCQNGQAVSYARAIILNDNSQYGDSLNIGNTINQALDECIPPKDKPSWFEWISNTWQSISSIVFDFFDFPLSIKDLKKDLDSSDSASSTSDPHAFIKSIQEQFEVAGSSAIESIETYDRNMQLENERRYEFAKTCAAANQQVSSSANNRNSFHAIKASGKSPQISADEQYKPLTPAIEVGTVEEYRSPGVTI